MCVRKAPRRIRTGRTDGGFQRRQELIQEYTRCLGGPNNVSQVEAEDITMAVNLQVLAETMRERHVADSLLLHQIEDTARDAVRALRLTGGRDFNPREDR